MRIPHAGIVRLFRSDPDEDRHLEHLSLPPATWNGFHCAALVLITVTILVALNQDGSNQAVAVGLLVITAIPWAIELRKPLPSQVFVPLVLVPVAALGIARRSDMVELGLGEDLIPFLLICVTAAVVAGAPRQVAASTSLGAVAALVVFSAHGSHYIDWQGTLIWLSALGFTIGAAAAIRMAVRALVEAREAQEQLARQEAADERRQVARDIHDVVAHTLAVTMLHVTAARMAVQRNAAEEAEEALEQAESHGRASLDDVRRIVRLLRADDAAPLDAAQPDLRDVGKLVESYRGAGLAIELSTRLDDDRQLSPTAELAAFRVLQEALANATRHGSGPTEVDVQAVHGAVSLRISNPISRRTTSGRRAGSGLTGMRERVAAAGGTLHYGADKGKWVVDAHIPATTEARPDDRRATDGWVPLSHSRGTPDASASDEDAWQWRPRRVGS